MLAVSKQSVFQPLAPRVAFWAPQADPAILGYALPCMVGFLHVSCARTCLHLLVTEMVVVNRQSNNGHVNAGITRFVRRVDSLHGYTLGRTHC